ncbi:MULTISPECIES: 2-keto-3-deoxygluconate transporter [Dickeya]|uniref:2-keto-3-deoxygluconate permease n=1 Tax=Dickeya oryzae TaxID=1240404 RepID=A0AB39ICL9_9GAMM|nr:MULTISPECIES: 2-keto-3-deoxygluconate transporter [Dickeya]MBP2850645.1 2-keto-3-deoxygluconate transporter [Dickeya oryzae]MBP2858281.1 2-keto-3-deoxygluconate transporter [Dickeya oryzae]MCA6993887.1 2-keto-3-deoxygluconate transporter [Dickeya oryzae]QIZ47496.1 2-keto-3-deoxygluconate transporter [Dickeya zeae]
MHIKRSIEKIPGGMMLVPLFLGALCHTFAPGAGKYFGSFTNGLISGTVPILAVWFFCMGASIRLSATATVLRKSGTLVVTKIAVAWVVAALASRLLPEHGVEAGFFAGLSTLALVAAMDMTNGGLYASIMQQYGTKEESGAFVLMSLESGPLMTMVILGTAGIASFEPHVFVGAVLPFLVGFVLGNLDPELREFFSRSVQTLIPFFAFALGNTIDLSVIGQTGFLGVMLGVAVIIITGIPLMVADKLLGGGDGTAGIAASSSAGAAVATPVLIAEMVPAFKPVAPAATTLVATSVIVTSVLVPIITAMWSKHVKGGDGTVAQEEGTPEQEQSQQAAHH